MGGPTARAGGFWELIHRDRLRRNLSPVILLSTTQGSDYRQLCTGASQGSETTKTKPSLSAILMPLVSLGVGFFYIFALSTITDKNLVKIISYIVFLPAIILLIICLIRSFIYLFYFHKTWSSLSETALGDRVAALAFLG